MLKIAILQNEKNGFPELISKSFQKAGYFVLFASQSEAYASEETGKKTAFISSSDNIRYFLKIEPDIFVIAPNVKSMSSGEKVACRSAVLCGEYASDFSKNLISERIVTYGMSPKDTVTMSSAVDKVTIAVQREIITLLNETIEIQEISIPTESNHKLNKLMAVACVQILSGTPFLKIPSLLSDMFIP